MTFLFLENADYEELQDMTETNANYQEEYEEYREDKMEKMISRYCY